MSVPIVVNGVNGKLLSLELQRKCPVLDLKRCIYEAWQIPPRAQKLICGTTVLQDAEEIDYHDMMMGKPLSVSMVVSLESIQASLEGTSHDGKVEAIETLPLLPILPPCEVISAVGLCLQPDSSLRMQAAVTHVLSRAIEEKDQTALQIALDFSRSPEVVLRITAARALWPLVLREEDRQVAVDAWMPLFTESWGWRQGQILEFLVQVAGTGTDIARDILIQWYDYNPGPVAVALQCISNGQEDQTVAAQRKSVVMSHLQSLGEDGPDGMGPGNTYVDGPRKRDVLTAMARLPYSCNLHEIAVLSEYFDAFASVGFWLPEVLTRSATNGGETGEAAKKLVEACLGYSDKGFRIMTLDALAAGLECSARCELASCFAMKALLDHDQDVMLKAIHLLGKCIKHGRQDARDAISGVLQHKQRPVRVAVKRALSLIE